MDIYIYIYIYINVYRYICIYPQHCKGAWLIRNRPTLGLYSRLTPRAVFS